jgi:hypothetical protein
MQEGRVFRPSNSYGPRTTWGNLRGSRFSLPPVFWSLEEDEIVDLLVSYGYSRDAAEREARLFSKYRTMLRGEDDAREPDGDQNIEIASPPLRKIQERVTHLLKKAESIHREDSDAETK